MTLHARGQNHVDGITPVDDPPVVYRRKHDHSCLTLLLNAARVSKSKVSNRKGTVEVRTYGLPYKLEVSCHTREIIEAQLNMKILQSLLCLKHL